MLNCPLPGHDDREPSCSVNLATNAFHCFGCERGGSILDFVAFMEELDPRNDAELRQSAQTLARIAGLALSDGAKGPKSRESGPKAAKTGVHPSSGSNGPPRAAQRQGEASPRSSLLDWHEPELVRNEPRPAPLQHIAYDHPYLAHRGLGPELARELEIGFYEGKGLMRGRITVAIRDWWPDGTSQLVAYLGRWPADEVPEGELRWKLPEGFLKTQVLYNLHRIAGRGRHACVVEGVFDGVRLHAMGEPAVALLGRSIAPEQVELLDQAGIRFTTVLLDGNQPGRDAAPKVAAMLAHRGLYARIVHLPDGTDPASVDGATLEALLRRSARP